MCNKAASDWLPSNIKAMWPVIKIFKMVGCIPNKHHTGYATRKLGETKAKKRKLETIKFFLRVWFRETREKFGKTWERLGCLTGVLLLFPLFLFEFVFFVTYPHTKSQSSNCWPLRDDRTHYTCKQLCIACWQLINIQVVSQNTCTLSNGKYRNIFIYFKHLNWWKCGLMKLNA